MWGMLGAGKLAPVGQIQQNINFAASKFGSAHKPDGLSFKVVGGAGSCSKLITVVWLDNILFRSSIR